MNKIEIEFVEFECDLPVMFTGKAEFYDGSEVWYVDGRRHRDDGNPARLLPDGTQEWWEEDRMHKKRLSDGSIKHYIHIGQEPEETTLNRHDLFLKMRRLGFDDCEIVKHLYEKFGPTDKERIVKENLASYRKAWNKEQRESD